MVMESKNTYFATIFTLIFHLLLLLLFWIVKVDWKADLTDFTEIAFMSGTTVDEAAALEFDQSLPYDSEKSTEISGALPLELPERKMLEQELPELKLFESSDKIASQDELILPEAETHNNRENLADNLIPSPSSFEKQTATPRQDLFSREKIVAPSSSISSNATDVSTPYSIEGQAAKRIVMYKVIPEFPNNFQKQALVKLSFSVLPNGQIGEISPLIKADAEIERITMEAFRQWRFDQLPANKPQQLERGIITFRYLLK